MEYRAMRVQGLVSGSSGYSANPNFSEVFDEIADWGQEYL